MGAASSKTRAAPSLQPRGHLLAEGAIAGEPRRDPHVVVDVPRDQLGDARDREHRRALPRAHEASRQRDDRQSRRDRVEARVAAGPAQRVQHRVAGKVRLHVDVVAHLRPHDHPLAARDALALRARRRGARDSGASAPDGALRTARGGSPGTAASTRANSASSSGAILNSDCGQRNSGPSAGSPSVDARDTLRQRGTRVARADARERHQPLGVVRLRTLGLHRRAR